MTELKKIEKKQKFMAQPKIIKKVFQTNKNLSNLDTQYHCKAMQKKNYKITTTIMDWFKNIPNKPDVNLIYPIKRNAVSSSSM